MSKYSPLQTHLKKSNFNNVPMTFKDIERVIGFELPASSRAHRAWWSNNPTNNVMTKAWLGAGFVTAEVDLASEKLVFFRSLESEPKKDIGKQVSHVVDHNKTKQRRHPLFGCLEGVLTIPEDLDLTQPADPEWGEKV